MPHQSVQELFSRTAARFPDHLAVARGEARVTYRELDERSRGIARLLLDGGVAKGTPVAILADHAEEVAAAILGVLGAGCAFVPLDPGTPAERLRALLGQVEPAWLLAGAGLAALAAEVAGGARVAPLDAEPPADPGGERLAPEWGPDDLCYVYFTSGSTGTPKAIAGRLKGIDHFVRWEIATFGVGEGTRVSQLTSPAFDASLRDLFVPLCAGGTVCAPATRDAVLDPAALVEWIDRERIELLHCVPSLFRAIVQREPAAERFAALRQVLLAGEPLPPADVRRWMDIFGERVELVNLYGPTETTMVKLFHRVVRADAGRRSIPVGRPMEGARAVVVDERDRPCPPGRVGEILIRTPYRTLGYYRQPELTARVFVPNPLSPRPDPDDLVYRTGDLGRVLEDGTLEVLGRRDHQIKLRGVRIEPGEVEHALRSHPAVRDVVVVDREDARGERLLCAYVVLAAPVPAEALREHLAGRLPEAMLPSVFVPLERLPLTTTGKTDRAALPWPPPAADAFVAPRTATEEALARIWADTLGVERVGVHDGFFALGGYSLLAAQAVARVREELGVVLPLRALFDSPTVAGMAERVEAARAPAAAPAEAPIPRAPRDGPLPLSFAQERVWTLQQLDPADTTHNMAGALRLSGALDPAALAEALAGVVRRHETLRTRFLATPAGEAAQTVDPPAPVPLPLDDLSPLPEAGRADEARGRIAAAVLRPFDLERGPPFRVMLLRLGEREHVLAWTVHHIVSDGWSSGVLAREVSALYAAAVGAGAPPLPELPVQYADYAAWQRRRFPADALERQLAWWHEHLAGGPPAPELPRDRPEPAVRTHAAAQEARVLPRELGDRLAALGRAGDATPFVVLFAAFAALLHRYTGERDLVVATAVAGRGFRELEGLIGFFVNTLALRTDLSGDPTFRELVARTRATAAAALAHQEVPFQAVARALGGAGGDSLTRVMFVHQHADAGSGLGLPGLEVQPFPVASGGESFDLTVWATDTPRGIAVRAQYPTDLYDAATVRRLLGHFATLLEGAAEDPDRRVSELPLLTAEERAQREAINRTEMPYPDALLHEQVEAQAGRTPDVVAVEWGDERLTYAELNRRANRLAHLLRARGVRPDGRVGVCVERSPEVVVAVLGILKAGAACVPLDPAYPRERLALMVADSGARPVVTTAALEGRAGEGSETLLLDREGDALAEMPAGDPVSGASADTLMYVVFTSGSTGRPKAVGVPHRVLANLIAWQHAQPGYAVGARTLQFSTLSFDASFQEIFSTWTTGGTLVLLSEEAHRDAARWVPLLSEARVERLFCPFVALRQLSERVEDGAPLPESLREVLPAGEQLQVTPALARLFERLPGRRVHNLYGPSETHVVTAHTLEGDPRAWPALPPIGRPVWNTRVHVLDAALQPVPAGIAGELYLGGDNLARGYLGRPELTAERFVPDPFAAAPGERLYRTGDRARLRPDGALDFLGRADEQVKVRGFRVEPGEVETVLALHPAVRGVAVTALADAGAGRRLVAHVVAGAPTTATELRAFLEERVPPHMVPAAFVLLERFPLLPSGKLDRRALPDPDAARPALEQPYEAPRTPAEQALAGVWSRLLRVEPVGIHDPFLELGGDSILGIQVVSQARRAGLRITLQQLFDLRTVAALAEAAGPVEGAAPGAERAPDGPGEGAVMTLPLAPMQQGILFHSLLAPDEAAYVEHVHCTCAGPWDADAFRGAWERLVGRHPALRTTFAWEAADEPVQVVHPHGELALEVHDWRARGEAARRELAARVGAEDSRRYALDRLPLMHLSVFLLEDASFDFVWSFHNIVLDGWSASAVLREFREDFDAARAGTRTEPPATLPFSRYLEWLADRPLDAARAYWAGALAGLAASTSLRSVLPAPAEDAAAHDGAYRRHGLVLSADATDRLRRGARRHGLTANDLFQGAWGLLLSRCTGEREVLFGAVTAGRSAGPEGVETAVGVLVNTLPVRLAVRSEAPLAEWLGELQRGQREARAHEHVPLHEIQRLAPAARFESILAFVNYPEDDAPSWLERRWSMQNVGYPLFVLARPGERLYLEVTFRAAEFAAPAVERLLAQLATTLDGMGEALAGDGAPPLARVPWLSAAERERLLLEWNRTDAVLPEGGLAERFAAQAARTPDATAVVWGAERVAYRELERRARRVAGALRAEGVGPETVVALLAARGLDFWTAALGVLLAGAAYLPLDPAHPPRRHRQVLEGSRAPLALASAGLRSALDAAAEEMDPAARPRVRALEEVLAAPDAGGGFPAPSPAGLAYVIFTSGSTGAPKGAMVEHRGMLNHLHAKVRELGIGPGDRVAQTASQCFDISVWQFLAPLLVGAEVHVLPDEVAHDPAALARETEARGITVLETVPSLMRTLVEELRGPGGAPLPLRALRWMIPTGEALPPGLAREWLDAYPHVPLLNAYGPTECSDDVTHHPVHAPPAPGARGVPIGRQLPNVRLYVVDAELDPIPEGIPGELLVGGVCVGRGYAHEPVRTADVFVPDPFGPVPGARLYRTGDRVRLLPDGTLEFLGRIDFQVKVRGFRVEPGEIEAALAEHPAVRQAAVVARDTGRGELRLVAYVAAHPDAAPTTAELRAHLAASLPEYMVPSAWVALDALPLGPTGKLDRRALPAPDADPAGPDAAYLPPEDGTERLLAEIWAALLRVERVGRADNFFERGGDSILAIQVASRARRQGLLLAPRDLFRHPTLAELAAAARPARRTEAEQGPVTGEVEPTPIQRWLLEDPRPDRHHFNNAVLLRAEEPLSPGALASAAAVLVRHHDALRLRFREGPEGWRGWIDAPGAPVFAHLDLSAAGGTGEDAVRFAAAELQRSLDLEAGPLARVALLDLGARRPARVLLLVHHLAVDGVSWRILLEDLHAAYAQAAAGADPHLPPKTTSFRDWAGRLHAHAASPEVRAEAAYWLEQSAPGGARLPADGPGGPDTVARERTVRVALGEAETRALLEAAAGRDGARPDEVLLAALLEAVCGWTGEDSLRVELEGHGRVELWEDVDLTRTVGWLTAEYPVRLERPASGGPGATLRAVRDRLRAVPGEGIGWGLLRHLAPADPAVEELRRRPRPEVVFNYLGQLDGAVPEASPFRPADEWTGPSRSPRAPRTHAVEVNAWVAGGRLHAAWAHGPATHSATVERVAGAFLDALRALLDGAAREEPAPLAADGLADFGWDGAELEEILAAVHRDLAQPGNTRA